MAGEPERESVVEPARRGVPSASLAAMYQEVILRHYRAPHGRGLPAGASAVGARRNPLCGDDIQVGIVTDGERILEAGFDGRGCAITTASASMLTDAVRGQRLDDVRRLMTRVERLVRGEAGDDADLPGDLIALAGVAGYPQRVGCAEMPWRALGDAVRG